MCGAFTKVKRVTYLATEVDVPEMLLRGDEFQVTTWKRVESSLARAVDLFDSSSQVVDVFKRVRAVTEVEMIVGKLFQSLNHVSLDQLATSQVETLTVSHFLVIDEISYVSRLGVWSMSTTDVKHQIS